MNYIIILALIALSLVGVGASITFPKIQVLEFEEMVITGPGSNRELCDKYHILFMDALHESLECSEDRAITPELEERCIRLLKLLNDYSRLRSKYCYDEEWGEFTL